MTKKADRLSSIRKRLVQIPSLIEKEMRRLVEPRAMFRGYVYRSKRRCGKPSCRCARGELHEAWVVATTVGGKRTTRSLSKEMRRRVLKLAAAYRRFRKAQGAIRKLHKETMDLTRELESLLCEKVFSSGAKR